MHNKTLIINGVKYKYINVNMLSIEHPDDLYINLHTMLNEWVIQYYAYTYELDENKNDGYIGFCHYRRNIQPNDILLNLEDIIDNDTIIYFEKCKLTNFRGDDIKMLSVVNYSTDIIKCITEYVVCIALLYIQSDFGIYNKTLEVTKNVNRDEINILKQNLYQEIFNYIYDYINNQNAVDKKYLFNLYKNNDFDITKCYFIQRESYVCNINNFITISEFTINFVKKILTELNVKKVKDLKDHLYNNDTLKKLYNIYKEKSNNIDLDEGFDNEVSTYRRTYAYLMEFIIGTLLQNFKTKFVDISQRYKNLDSINNIIQYFIYTYV